jgi:hypothetical protein
MSVGGEELEREGGKQGNGKGISVFGSKGGLSQGRGMRERAS